VHTGDTATLSMGRVGTKQFFAKNANRISMGEEKGGRRATQILGEE